MQTFEVMAELEGMAARLAGRRLSAIDRQTIVTAREECRRAAERGDTDAYYDEANVHQAMNTASRNGFLIDQCVTLQCRSSATAGCSSERKPSEDLLREHEEIVEAIFAGESKRAEEALKKYTIIQGERFGDLVALLAEGPAAPFPPQAGDEAERSVWRLPVERVRALS